MGSGQQDRLDSWKEIAEYLRRDLATVRRWEDKRGLPVHRVPGAGRQAVFAYKREIDGWLKSGASDQEPGVGELNLGFRDQGPGAEEVGAYNRESPVPDRVVVVFPQSTREALTRPLPHLAIDGTEGVRQRREIRRWALAAATMLAGAAALALWLRPAPSLPHVLSYSEVSKGIEADRDAGGIVTDGLRLYFNRDHLGIVEVSTAGGEAAPLPLSLRGAAVQDISPAHAELLLSTSTATGSESPLWIFPLPAGSPHRLGNVLAHGAAWSPDGRQIVVAQGKSLYLTDNEGIRTREIVSLRGTPWNPRWSPDGRSLRFTLEEERRHTLWEVAATGGNPHPLFPDWAGCRGTIWLGNWTPDGRYYVFDCVAQHGAELWALREKGDFLWRGVREPVRLATGPMTWWNPVPSPDGKKIFAIGQAARAELVRYDSNSGQFIPYLAGLSADMLDFSRDGTSLTYVEYPERALFRSKVDGGEKLQLTLPKAEVAYPRWSPDGRWIAHCAYAGKAWKIYLISAEGGAPLELVPGEANQAHPSWSSDGHTLAFAGAPWMENFAPASTAVHLIHLKDRRIETLPGSQGLWSPRWSPDGRYIAALTTDSRRVMVFDFGAQSWSEVASGLYVDYTCWSHDGKSLYFSTFSNEGDPAVYRVELSQPRSQRVLSLKSIQLTQTVGLWFGLAPDDSFLFLRDTSVEAVYALDVQWP